MGWERCKSKKKSLQLKQTKLFHAGRHLPYSSAMPRAKSMGNAVWRHREKISRWLFLRRCWDADGVNPPSLVTRVDCASFRLGDPDDKNLEFSCFRGWVPSWPSLSKGGESRKGCVCYFGAFVNTISFYGTHPFPLFWPSLLRARVFILPRDWPNSPC